MQSLCLSSCTHWSLWNIIFIFRWSTSFERGWVRRLIILLTLKKLLVFITGADHMPPLGFPSKSQIIFTDTPKKTLPRACLPALFVWLHLTNYENIRDAFHVALISGNIFSCMKPLSETSHVCVNIFLYMYETSRVCMKPLWSLFVYV